MMASEPPMNTNEEELTTENAERVVSAKDLSPRITRMDTNEEDLTTKSTKDTKGRNQTAQTPASPIICHSELAEESRPQAAQEINPQPSTIPPSCSSCPSW
jgi:hypothetical protein